SAARARTRTGPAQTTRLTTCRDTTSEYTFIGVLSPASTPPRPERYADSHREAPGVARPRPGSARARRSSAGRPATGRPSKSPARRNKVAARHGPASPPGAPLGDGREPARVPLLPRAPRGTSGNRRGSPPGVLRPQSRLGATRAGRKHHHLVLPGAPERGHRPLPPEGSGGARPRLAPEGDRGGSARARSG